MIIIPQAWTTAYAPLPDRWLEQHAPGLLRVCPEFPQYLTRAAKAGHCDERLVVTRIELEQGLGYAFDGSTRDYGGGAAGDAAKLKYLCGVDKTDSGPRPGGWFGPERQTLGCTLRFGYWYRGEDGPEEGMENWLGLAEDPRYQAGVTVTRDGVSITPANQASADCLRYTTSMAAQHRLREIGMRWFAEDYAEEESAVPTEREVTMEQFRAHLAKVRVTRDIDEVVIHHTWSPDASQYRGIETVRGVRRYHTGVRGWRDNGYHVMIGPDGAIFLCRPMEQSGAHTAGRNAHTIGVSFIANFDSDEPAKYPGLRIGHQVVAALLERFGLDAKHVRFHREFAPKTCPGLKLSLAEFRRNVEAVAKGSDAVRIILGTGPEPEAVIDASARVEDGTLRADVRPLLEALGYTLHPEHIASQGKLYIEETSA